MTLAPQPCCNAVYVSYDTIRSDIERPRWRKKRYSEWWVGHCSWNGWRRYHLGGSIEAVLIKCSDPVMVAGLSQVSVKEGVVILHWESAREVQSTA